MPLTRPERGAAGGLLSHLSRHLCASAHFQRPICAPSRFTVRLARGRSSLSPRGRHAPRRHLHANYRQMYTHKLCLRGLCLKFTALELSTSGFCSFIFLLLLLLPFLSLRSPHPPLVFCAEIILLSPLSGATSTKHDTKPTAKSWIRFFLTQLLMNRKLSF